MKRMISSSKPESQEDVVDLAIHHLWKRCIKSFKNFGTSVQLCPCLEFSSHLFVFLLCSTFPYITINIPII